MVRILLSVLQFRVNARYVEANPPFTGIGAHPAASGLCVLQTAGCWLHQSLVPVCVLPQMHASCAVPPHAPAPLVLAC